MLAARRSKDYWKWRMLGVFIYYYYYYYYFFFFFFFFFEIFFFWGISHIRAFLQVDDF